MGRAGWLVLGAALASAALTWVLTATSNRAGSGAPLPAEFERLEAENRALRGHALESGGPGVAAPSDREPGPSPALSAKPPPPDPFRPLASGAAPVDPVELWIQGLRKAVEDGDERLQDSFRLTLVAHGAKGAPALATIALDRREPAALRLHALTALLEMKASGRLDVAIEILSRRDEHTPLWMLALTVAAEAAGPKAHEIAAVREAMGSGRSLPERQSAIEVVFRGDPLAALPAVRDLLSSSDPNERAVAHDFLEQASDPAYRDLVEKALASDLPVDTRTRLRSSRTRSKGPTWSAAQAAGEPDTTGHGDIPSAWATKREDMGEVSLELDYADAVRPDAVRIHETYNPGGVARIEANVGGRWETLWEGTAPSPGPVETWFEPRLSAASGRTSTIRLVLDTNRVPGWNEIDAVELVGDGLRQWARSARATSSYSDP